MSTGTQPEPRLTRTGAVRNTALYTVLYVPAGLLVALGTALLLNRSTKGHDLIPLSEFELALANDKVAWITIDGDEVSGEFNGAEGLTIPDIPKKVKSFRTVYPAGTFSSGGPQLSRLMELRKNAKVTAENNQNLVVNLLLPLIPWLLSEPQLEYFHGIVLTLAGAVRRLWPLYRETAAVREILRVSPAQRAWMDLAPEWRGRPWAVVGPGERRVLWMVRSAETRPAFVESPMTATRTTPVWGLSMMKVESSTTNSSTRLDAEEVGASTTVRRATSPKRTFC